MSDETPPPAAPKPDESPVHNDSDTPPRVVPPPAANTVLQGKAKEGAKDLQAELEAKLKARELRVMELEDENRTLKTARETPPPTPKPKRKGGWTFFDEED